MLKFTIIMSLLAALVLAAVPHLLWIIILIMGKIAGFRVRYAPFGLTAAALVLLTGAILCYGYFVGRFRLDIKEIEYAHKDIPEAFDGYKIVHISDFHLCTFDDKKEHVGKIVDRINSLNPDLICFTGDLVNTDATETIPYIEDIRRLSAQDGVTSVLGNHDFMLYSFSGRSKEERDAAVQELVNAQNNGFRWKVLRNSSLSIQRGRDSISIIGVDNHSCEGQGFQTISNGDLSKAMKDCAGFKVLLTHDPSHWSHEVVPDTDIQLTLSGHTHAAQIKLFGWTPASWVFNQTNGRYDKDGQTLYINIGLGCTAPIRIGADPEITLITLKTPKS